MKIKRAYIKNFTVFDEVEVEFSKGINIFIGTNGMGKTHLLKLLYSHKKTNNYENSFFNNLEDSFGTSVSDLLRNRLQECLFSIHAPKIFDNKSINIKENLSKIITSSLPGKVYEEYYYKKISSSVENFKITPKDPFYFQSSQLPLEMNHCIFIPSKEILSHSKGFLALNHQMKLSFDSTYADIIANAELPEARTLSPISQNLLAVISKIISGTIIHEDGSFYLKKEVGGKVIFPLEAEGFKKFGLLWKLIQNGLFEEDTKLFWDEPEANINPELIPDLVGILLALQKNGVQIFIATHNYNLAKYLELKCKEKNTILYHSMSMTENGVKVESYTSFSDIPNNPIIEADSLLLDEIYEFDKEGE